MISMCTALFAPRNLNHTVFGLVLPDACLSRLFPGWHITTTVLDARVDAVDSDRCGRLPLPIWTYDGRP